MEGWGSRVVTSGCDGAEEAVKFSSFLFGSQRRSRTVVDVGASWLSAATLAEGCGCLVEGSGGFGEELSVWALFLFESSHPFDRSGEGAGFLP